MLRFAEEIVLLSLRDDDGKFIPVPVTSMQHALAGAVLMDLALENRIDTDTENLILIDSTPTGDSLLDPTLEMIAAGSQRDARHWIDQVAKTGDEIRSESLNRLIQRGILEQHEERFLWVFRSRRYPMIDGREEREVKLRIMGVLFSDDLPDPRDIVIICLADACGILRHLIPKRELDKARDRIEQVRKLDLIGQAMIQAIHDIELWLATGRIEGRIF